MRIHTGSLERHDLEVAARIAGVSLVRDTLHGSNSHAHAYEVILSGSGSRLSQYRDQDVPAATWDEWGIFLAELYQRDPQALVGGAAWPVYADARHFAWATGDRFNDLAPEGQHRNHRWYHVGESAGGVTVNECKCGAIQRQLAYRRTWREFANA